MKINRKRPNIRKSSIDRAFRNIVGSKFRVVDVIEERVHQFIKKVRREKIRTRNVIKKGYFCMERIPVRTNAICSMYARL